MKKAIVTGGAGFIGSHLARTLRERGYHTTILDDLSTGRKENIAGIVNGEDVVFVEGSVTDLALLQRLLRGADYVFHQAALPSVPRSVGDPLRSHEVNATGTLKVLLAARDNHVSKVIYASSSSVYGETPVLPKSEDMAPRPQSPYAVAKLAGEYYCRVFAQAYGLPTACLRYFNVYGPGQSPDSEYAAVIPQFIRQAQRGEPAIVYGDGGQTRDFTYVGDVVAANLLAAEGEAAGVFNVGRGERVSVSHLAETIGRLAGSKVEPVQEETRPGDVRDSQADISRLAALGYRPQYSLEEGLRETIESFK